MRRDPHPFAPPAPGPASGPARGCLPVLAWTGGLILAAAGLCAFTLGAARIAEATLSPWPSTWIKPEVSAPVRLPAARRAWGEIRARYRRKVMVVPA